MADGTHVLITGPISGRVAVDHPAFEDGSVDVTPNVLALGTHEEALAVAAAIEKAHVQRGTHPIQLADRALRRDSQVLKRARDEHGAKVVDDALSRHEQQKRDLAKRTEEEV